MKIKILALSAAVVSACTIAACSFGPDAYNGPSVCPGDPPPDTVMVPDGECWDGGLPPDSGTASGGADTAGGGGADATGGAAVAGGAGTSTAGTGGASTAGTGG